MITVLVCMAVGMFMGLKIIPEKYQKINGMLQYVFIAVLIFGMGAGLGSSPTFFADLQNVGLKSLMFAVLPIVFSVICVYILTKNMFKENKP
ncbi:putative permease membrane protein [Hydrogenoanaerobacterium saccharovorans]|uniref:Predicted Permease Membrane Region n=1 Tax=Hydrogenoanaerobacterium saccharovorans TaxID=474960 RepID=A0A1H8AAJ1_9FIRM|nr:LysO family transporter [Hydrogenoanaerobacterium saccharovorans]RPF48053.1 putative permease membrane protein [Hydrogenoanaerobacterium saccharovorans]SEM67795.1 Predicted Permease Membrane Region [Hydrogenoanaerobacterium saccharovorans]